MSRLKIRWKAIFCDGYEIIQPDDDRYSKHDDGSDWNPSAFRDILDYEKKSKLKEFCLFNEDDKTILGLELGSGTFLMEGRFFMLERVGEEIENRKIIYFRSMRLNVGSGEVEVVAYNLGYKGIDKESGKMVEKVITIYG